MRHPRPESIRLKPFHRYLFYSVVILLFLSGTIWTFANYIVPLSEEIRPMVKSRLMKVHGAAAMAALVLIGTILTAHVRFAWRADRNRMNGIISLTTLGILIITGYALYYSGDERFRAWNSWIHLGFGLALPAILLIHVAAGRKTRPVQRQKPHHFSHLADKIDI